MPINRKLFGVANYVMALVYAFLFLGALRFTVEKVPAEEDLTPFMPFMISLAILLLNAVLNIYVFHRHLPGKPFSRSTGTCYFIAAILYGIALTIVSISFIRNISDELSHQSTNNADYYLLLIFLLHLIVGLFILINQLKIRKHLVNNHTDPLNNPPTDNL